MRDGAQPSCPVPYELVVTGTACHTVRGAPTCADAEYPGPLEASVNATRRSPRLETTTFGWGEKNVTAARHGDCHCDIILS